MCLLALFFRVVEDAPVVVGANREEMYARGGEPPRILDSACPALAGVDPVAGGTWLGVNARGLLVAITNRLKTSLPRQPRSRGLLARELLACPSAAAASERAGRELGKNLYAGCNLLCVDRDAAFAIHAGDWLRVRPLPPGLHIMTAHDVNDASDRRLGHALWWLSQRSYANGEQCGAALRELCTQPGNGDPPICLRGERGGTVSSTVVILHSTLPRSSYWHAQGPPDRTPYDDYSNQLRHLLAGVKRA
ncbi:MAG: NRDE family protein [Planctomycetota bacterium]|nr:MAG: NRDE family protein [Planctomycetota bacterium]